MQHVLEVGSGAVASVATLVGLTDMLVNGVANAKVAPVSIAVAVVTGLTGMFTAYYAHD